MSCASATGSEDKFEYFIFQDDDENSQDQEIVTKDPSMAETHDNQYRKWNHNADDEEERMLYKRQNEINTKECYENFQNIASFGGEPVDELLALANDDATAVETANLLLSSEHQQNFVDFDEFNICLNNILNEDVDPQLDLSPSVVMSDSLTTAEVDELFKVNIDLRNKSIDSATPASLNDKDVSSISGSSNKSNSILHNETLSQMNNGNNSADNNTDTNDLLGMVQFNDHMDFSFSSDLDNNIMDTNTTNTINNKMGHDLPHGHNYVIDKNNIRNVVDVDGNDLDINMIGDPINVQSICNSSATVSASVTTATRNNNNDDDNDVTQETALNNVMKHNSHSIVNIFQ